MLEIFLLKQNTIERDVVLLHNVAKKNSKKPS
jgi:hypothetical protein